MAKRIPQSHLVQGGVYHVYNRGNRKQIIFNDNKDYKKYLERLREYKKKHNASVLAYCLMPNHLHLLIRQNGPQPLSLLMQRLHTSYSMHYNKRYETVGHVFQDRSYFKIVDKDEYLMHLSRYIHLNPQGIVSKLPSYKWSSYPEYIGEIEDPIADTKFVLSMFKRKNQQMEDAIRSYVEFTRAQQDTDLLHKVLFGEDSH